MPETTLSNAHCYEDLIDGSREISTGLRLTSARLRYVLHLRHNRKPQGCLLYPPLKRVAHAGW